MPLPIPSRDQIFNQLNSGRIWPSLSITFSFPTSPSQFSVSREEAAGFTPLLAAGQEAVRLALSLWDDLIVSDFREVSTNGGNVRSDLEFGLSLSGVDFAHAYYPTAGSVWFNASYGASAGTNNLINPTVGRHGFLTYVHEIGHALGLNHAGNYNGTGDWQPLNFYDSSVFSIMSYFGPNWASGQGSVEWADWVGADNVLYSPQTPMLNDIYVIQRMYGAEVTTRLGDTVYGFNSNITNESKIVFDFSLNKNPIITIYDSGGSDTLDLSGWSTSGIIDLRQGRFSSCNSMTNNIAISYGCDIENARGGAGSDKMFGNSLDNILNGGAGDDWFNGLEGNDKIYGGSGNDTVFFNLASSSYQITPYQSYITVQRSGMTTVIYESEYLEFSDSKILISSLNSLSDVTAPTILSFSPADGTSSVAVGSNIALNFSENIARGSGSITLRSGSPTGSIIESFDAATSSRISISGSILTIDPTNILANSTNYFLVLETGNIKDLLGNSHVGVNSYDFQTSSSDATAPTVLSFSPADGASSVAVGSNISLTFSENITRGAGTITLRSGSPTGSIIESFDATESSRISISGTTLTIDPTSSLPSGTLVFITFAAGSIRDLAGNAYSGTSSYDFTTAGAVITDDFPSATDTTGVVTVDGNSSDGRIETSGDADAFKVNLTAGTTYIFSLTATSGSLDPYLEIYNSEIVLVASNDDYGSSQNSRITFTPTTGGIYYLKAFDFSGTATGAYKLQAIKPDLTAPTILSFFPADGSTAVSLESSVILSFSEDIARGSGSIALRSGSPTGSIIESFDAATSSRLLIFGSRLTIDPTGTLPAGTQIFVTFTAGSIKDLAGNAYSGTSSYDFTTAGAVITDDFPSATDTTGIVTIDGKASDGKIETAGDADAFKVTLIAGTTYNFSLTATSGSLDPYLELYNADLVKVAYNDDYSSDTYDSGMTFTATYSGTYYLRASDYDDSKTGNYQLTANPTSQNRSPSFSSASQSVSTNEDTAKTITLAATDADSDSLTYTAATPANGTVSVSGAVVTYTPKLNYNGTDSFVVTASDGKGGTATQTVNFSVSAVNDAPTFSASSQSVSATAGAAKTITLAATDVDGDTLTYSVGTPGKGTASISGNTLTYSPTSSASGIDSFVVTASDGRGGSSTQTINATVTSSSAEGEPNNSISNSNDIFFGQAITGQLSTSTDVDYYKFTTSAAGVVNLAFDAPTNSTLSYYQVSVYDSSNVLMNRYSTGSDKTYQISAPAAGTFYVRITGDGFYSSDNYSVTLTQTTSNNAPAFSSASQSVSTNEDTAKTITLAATDADSDPLTYTAATPANGTVSVSGAVVTYTPKLNFNGSDSFVVTASDGKGGTATQTVNVTVAAVEDESTGNISMSGTASQGGSVTANVSAIDVDGAITGVSYLWQMSLDGVSVWTNLNAATSATYGIASDQSQVGKYLRVVATTTDALGGTTTFTSAATAAIASVDTTSPSVSSITYGTNDGALSLGETVTLTVTLSEAVNVTGTPTLALANGGVATYTGGTGTSSLSFSYTAAAGQTTADLATAASSALTGTIKDLAGNAVTAAGFNNVNPTGTLAVDVAAPIVSTFAPADDATGVAVSSNIVLTFSEVVRAGAGTITLRSGSATGTIVESFDAATSNRLTFSGSALTIDPTSNLSANTQYFVVFSSANIKDTAGNAYAGISTYDFRTAALADTVAPTFTSAATSVDGLKVILTYSEALNATTAAKTAFAVKVAAVGATVSSTATVNSVAVNGSTIELTLASAVAQGQAVTVGYTAPLVSAASSNAAVQDIAGNDAATLAATTVVTNNSAVDKTAPTVSTFAPTDGATGVLPDANIVVTFSEAIARGTGTITLRSVSATGTIVESFDAATSNRLTLSGSTLTIDPTSDLAANTQYFVVLSSGNIKDAAGNAYAGISTYDFKTASIFNGTANNDTLTGTIGADTINGLAGNDVITGGAGTDIMNGGDGSDLYIIAAASEHAAAEIADSGASGTDEVRFTSAIANATLTLFAGDTGIEQAVIGTGTASAAVTTATTALNINAAALSYGLALIGNAGANTLTGGSGADSLQGGAGNDTLTGGAGADQLRGGIGLDTLTGGADVDWFIFDTAPNATTNRDTITDFVSGTDKLQFSKAVFTGLSSAALGDLTTDAFWSGAGVSTAHDATDRFIYNTTTGALFYDADGNANGSTAVQVALLGATTHPSLGFADIQIIG